MRTTIEIAADVLARAKRMAQREGKTLRQMVDEALRLRLAETPEGSFRLRKHSFRGRGLHPGIIEGRWESIRDLIHKLA